MSRLFRISLMLAVFFGLEKLLGFLRQVLIARQFGLSAELDAFNAANNLPDLLFALISGGALAMAFIPVLSETLQLDGREVTWRLFSRVANLVFLVTAVLAVVIAVFAGPLVRARLGIAPGFGPQQQALVVDLMRLNLFATLIFSISGLVMAGLQANQHFLLPAIAPSMYDIGSLVGVLVLAPQKGYNLGPVTLPAFGMGVYGLVYGVIIGAALFLAVQVPGLLRYDFRWVPSINFSDPYVQKVLRLMGPRVLTVFFIQLVFVVQDNLASGLPEGAVTALVYGWLIMQMPETLVGTAIGTAVLPTLSEQVARGESEAFSAALGRTVQAILAVTLPLAVVVGLVLPPLVQIFGLSEAGTQLVVSTARAFLLGLIGHSLLEVAVRSFYARQDARTPLLAAFGTAILFLLLAVLLAPVLGAPGIGLANSIAFSAEAVFLLVLLWRNLRQRNLRPRWLAWGALARLAGGAVVGGAVCFFILQALQSALASVLGAGLLAGMVAAVGAALFGALAALPFIWPETKLLVKL